MAELMTDEQAEVIAEIAPEVANAFRQFSLGFVLLSTAAGLVGGVMLGYGIAGKRLRDEYAQVAEDEIDQMREHFRARLVAKETKPDLSGLGKVTEELGYNTTQEPVEGPVVAPVPEPETQNVFVVEDTTISTDDWDYEVELASRTPERPYVIHKDERNETDYTETTLTYYEQDDVLCDETDKVIDAKDEVVGEHNFKFGHGSGDIHIVYVRNDRLGVDIELIRSRNSYAEEVHGLSHMDYPRRRDRPRFDDE